MGAHTIDDTDFHGLQRRRRRRVPLDAFPHFAAMHFKVLGGGDAHADFVPLHLQDREDQADLRYDDLFPHFAIEYKHGSSFLVMKPCCDMGCVKFLLPTHEIQPSIRLSARDRNRDELKAKQEMCREIKGNEIDGRAGMVWC
jgi:hypothetical protein